MRAVFSVTNNDLYLFFMPIVAWSWKKIGVDSVIVYVTPKVEQEAETARFILAGNYLPEGAVIEQVFVDDKEQEATYSQVSRLFAATLPDIGSDEVIITADADMAVFGDYLIRNDGDTHVFGHDLVDHGQYPMCYLSMPKKEWQYIMDIGTAKTMQQHLDELLQPLVCEHMRGNYWCFDQETAWNKILASRAKVHLHGRANLPHRFATRRADRDSWPDQAAPDIIDAHLPRPGYREDNFQKVVTLIQQMYPMEDLTWIREYRDLYVKTF